MVFRILIKSVNVNVVSYNWYNGPAGNLPWETKNEAEALQKYQELLDSYSLSNLTLIQIVPVDISIKTSQQWEKPILPHKKPQETEP